MTAAWAWKFENVKTTGDEQQGVAHYALDRMQVASRKPEPRIVSSQRF
jgi:hypothetical protein